AATTAAAATTTATAAVAAATAVATATAAAVAATAAVATATAAVAATAAAAAATEATATAAALFAGLRLVDGQGSTAEGVGVILGDRLFAFVGVRHLDEAEAAALAGVLVLNNCGVRDLAHLGKEILKLIRRGAVGQAAHIDAHCCSPIPTRDPQS